MMRLLLEGVLDVAIDIAPEVLDAVRKSGPGGRRITRAERKAILAAVERALVGHGEGT